MENKTENRNERALELDPEQMEKVSGGTSLDEGQEFTCSQCGAAFKTYHAYISHQMLMHRQPEDRYQR